MKPDVAAQTMKPFAGITALESEDIADIITFIVTARGARPSTKCWCVPPSRRSKYCLQNQENETHKVSFFDNTEYGQRKS
jgi:hypothetical protein